MRRYMFSSTIVTEKCFTWEEGGEREAGGGGGGKEGRGRGRGELSVGKESEGDVVKEVRDSVFMHANLFTCRSSADTDAVIRHLAERNTSGILEDFNSVQWSGEAGSELEDAVRSGNVAHYCVSNALVRRNPLKGEKEEEGERRGREGRYGRGGGGGGVEGGRDGKGGGNRE